VEGKSGTAKSLAYARTSGTLFVLHSFGPDHLRLMSVDAEGKLRLRPERHTINTYGKRNRVATMVVVSPNEKFVLVGTVIAAALAEYGEINGQGLDALFAMREAEVVVKALEYAGMRSGAGPNVAIAESPRRFPVPWRADKVPGGYGVRDANGQALAYIYPRDDEAEAGQAKVLTKDEARRIAINIARLPELLGKADRD
jgi:hypothetical protein